MPIIHGMAETVREAHDRLLAEKPDGASHNTTACSFCAVVSDHLEGAPVTTYTEDELRAAVDAAVGELRSELDAFKASQEAAAVETRIATAVTEAKTPLEAQVAELQASLDAKVLEVQAEKARAEALEAEKVAAVEAAALEARREDRLTAVREVASFPEEYLVANADRFAAMNDDDFAARVEEWKQIAVKTENEGLPAKTALTATSESTTKTNGSAVKELFALRRAGLDPRSL